MAFLKPAQQAIQTNKESKSVFLNSNQTQLLNFPEKNKYKKKGFSSLLQSPLLLPPLPKSHPSKQTKKSS